MLMKRPTAICTTTARTTAIQIQFGRRRLTERRSDDPVAGEGRLSDAFGFLVVSSAGEFLRYLMERPAKLITATMGVGMNQVERRQREQLRPEELALLKTCGGEIRKGDHRALELARSSATECLPVESLGKKTIPSQRFCKAHGSVAVLKAIARRTWALIKAVAAQFRRRPGLRRTLP